MVIIPVQNSPLDIRSTQTTVELIHKAKELNPRLREYFLLYKIQSMTQEAKELSRALKQTYEIEILKSCVSNREAYKQSLIYGKGISEFSHSGLAVSEFKSLVNEIKSVLDNDEFYRHPGQKDIQRRQL